MESKDARDLVGAGCEPPTARLWGCRKECPLTGLVPQKKYNHLHFEQAGVSGASPEPWEEQDLKSDTAVECPSSA